MKNKCINLMDREKDWKNENKYHKIFKGFNQFLLKESFLECNNKIENI